MMYRQTGKKEYLDHAIKIGKFIMNHPRLPKDKIPYWDFDAPNIPKEDRDASAGAIMASAYVELSTYVEGGTKQTVPHNSRTTDKIVSFSCLSAQKK